ncbi:MAG: 4-hydroxybutyrate--acetyl-CoA CoA transferase [Lachnospiraceae bacterium]|nr:4-hydroxybutyrate--acetyl-CoA CoA transferase [Lachnospiraceae bacterium]
MDYRAMYESKKSTIPELLSLIQSGDCVVTGTDSDAPVTILKELHTIGDRVDNVWIVKGADRIYPFMTMPELHGKINCTGLIMGAGNRESQKTFNYQYMPANLHDWIYRWEKNRPITVLLTAATPMDEDGYLYMSTCLINEAEALKSSSLRNIIVQVNSKLPVLKSEAGRIHISQITGLIEADEDLFTVPAPNPSETDKIIGATAAEFINDGDTIQIGLGGTADMVAVALESKKDLGLHTELFTPGIGHLIRIGVITGERKTVYKGRHVGTFAIGDEALYEDMGKNPAYMILPGQITNDPFLIAQNDNMKSVNTALEIDLTGQICSESMGSTMYSGTGGATDFAYGALHSKGGRGIIAIASTAKKGTLSKIKPQLTPGATVSISRNLADTIITEYGVAELKGRTITERAQMLIRIAHPDFRDELTFEAKRLGLIW